MMEDIEELLEDFVYLTIIKRINMLIHLRSEGRLEAIASMVKITTEDIEDPDFNIEDESEFSNELYQLLVKYNLLDEINTIRIPRRS